MNIWSIHWHNAEKIVFFVALIPLVAALLLELLKQRKAFAILAPSGSLAGAQHATVRLIAKALAIVLGASFLIISLLRPQWDKKEETMTHWGRDIVVAVDISRSMLCKDLEPDRLTVAKKKIEQLVTRLPSDRKALLLFAGAPFIICPLTHDHQSFMMFLKQIDASTISSAGTSLEKALRKAIELLKKNEQRKTKMIVVFTDGEDFSPSLSSVAHDIQQYGLNVFVVCLGTKEGGPIPLYDNKGALAGHQKNKDGSIVITKPHYDQMNQLVASASGVCLEATPDSSDIAQLALMIEQHEKEILSEQKKETYQEKYQYSAVISFIFLLVAFLL